MSGPVTRYLEADHVALHALLERAVAVPGAVEPAAYAGFRAGILRHIAIEEKILFPALRGARGGEPHPDWRRLRIDHGAIGSLLVPFPTPELVTELRSILEPHDVVEEGPHGVYADGDVIAAVEASELVERMRAYPAVRVAPHRDGPRLARTAAEALALSAKQLAVREEP
ncbi:MAG: hemerythrin domain-containing protein [Anaeromyxobacter sp.]